MFGPLISPREARTNFASIMQSAREARTRWHTPEYLDYFVTKTAAPEAFPLVRLELTLFTPAGSWDLAPFVKKWGFRSPGGGRATCSAVLVDDGIRNRWGPNLSPADPYYGLIEAAREGDLTRYLVAAYWIGPERIPLPDFLQEDPEWDGNVCTLHGADFQAALDREGLHMDDIVLTEGDIAYSWGTLQAIGAFVGLNVQVETSFRNFLMGELRRSQGRPVDWMSKVLKQYCGRKDIRSGRSLRVWAPKFRTEGGADWSFDGEREITSFRFREATQDLQNQHKVNRLASNSRILKIHEPKPSGKLLGRNGDTIITFDGPGVAQAWLEYRGHVTNGDLVDFVWKDAAGNPVGVVNSATFTASDRPAQSVQFTYVPGMPWTSPDLPSFRVTVYGRRWGKGPPIVETGPYNAVDIDHASEGFHGLKPQWTAIEDPVIASGADLVAAAAAQTHESVRRGQLGELKALLNAKVLGGDHVDVTHYETRQDAMRWMVESRADEIDFEAGSATMTLELARPRTF